MHSSRMCTACSLIVSPYLVISHACPPEQPHMPPRSNHAHPLGATMHAPRATTHAPWSNHAPPGSNHACPPRAAMHAPPEQPHMPPRATMHAPWEQLCMAPSKQPCTPQRNQTCPPVDRMTDMCKNITFTNFVCGWLKIQTINLILNTKHCIICVTDYCWGQFLLVDKYNLDQKLHSKSMVHPQRPIPGYPRSFY